MVGVVYGNLQVLGALDRLKNPIADGGTLDSDRLEHQTINWFDWCWNGDSRKK